MGSPRNKPTASPATPSFSMISAMRFFMIWRYCRSANLARP